jgi:hypothetical protein
MEARQFSAAIVAIKQIVILSGIRIERSERGAPGELGGMFAHFEGKLKETRRRAREREHREE